MEGTIREALSVVMTNYNDSAFLYERISSILNQLREQDEFIFIDDASTDASVEIVESFVKNDARLKFYKNRDNEGVVSSVNKALELTSGKFVVFLAADDRILPGFIQKTCHELSMNPEFGLCCSECAMWYDGFPDMDPKLIYTTHLIKNVSGNQYFPRDKIVSIFRNSTFWVPGHTTIFKRSEIAKYGGFEASLGPLCDWFLNHAIALEGGAIYIPEELSIWRQHRKSYSQTLSEEKGAKRYQKQFFRVLHSKKYRHLRSLFMKAKLTNHFARKNLLWLLFRPHDWDILFYWCIKVFHNRKRMAKEYFKSKFLFRKILH